MLRKLFSGWFKPMNVSPLEGFFMRLLFALALVYTIRMGLQFTTEPHPAGLLKLLHKIDGNRTWLTWLSDDHAYEIYRWSFIGVMALYVAGFALPVVLPVASLLHILPFTLFNSQGYTYHGAAMISMVLHAQTLTVLWYSIRKRFTLGPPDGTLRGWLLLQSMMIVTGAYFISVIAKMENSHGAWLWNSNNVAVDMIKTSRQTYFNRNGGPPPTPSGAELDVVRNLGITDVLFHSNAYPVEVIATWMLERPWTSRIMFDAGVFLEVVCILGIGNRMLALLFGVSLITMHRSIDVLMGGVQFPYNELCDFIFLVGLPFGLAWLFERIPVVRARYAAIAGAGVGMIASYWLHPSGGHNSDSLTSYFFAMLNTVYGVWSSQDWAGFFQDTRPLFLLALVGAVIGAASAWFFPRNKPPPLLA